MPRVPELLRDVTFRRFWVGETVSLLGDQITLLALPLTAVLVLHASALEMGVLTAIGWLPSLLFSLHAGMFVDRSRHKRRHMIVADVGRAAVLVSVPVAMALGHLAFPQLCVVAFTAGTLEVFFYVAYYSLFQALARRDQYLSAQALLNGSRAATAVAGPTVAGALVSAFTAPIALLADATTFLVSAFALSRIRPQEAVRGADDPVALLDGVRFIVSSQLMRRLLGCSATVNFFNLGYWALFTLFAVQELGIGPAALGLLLGAGSIGAVLGSAVSVRLSNRTGVGRTFAISCVLFPAPLLLVAAAPSRTVLAYALVACAEFLSGVGLMLYDITIGSLQAAAIPATLRSRVGGAYRTVNYGVRPVGSLAAGIVAAVIGLRSTMWIAAGGGVLCALWLVGSPVLGMRTLEDTTPPSISA